ncbi:uncharacterized protein ASPGLDRAFT_49735 [Aspergillus glaucus CBS 516.65]|uniref:Uncharacterized protein n=1 Tax=Aspergillus glaucus CBS 516.65 TaxID=1160497 RepID=A0A1L9VCX2_ASPGL|nr:hypothetical protein ASPGLDRAFT_49735 [Aspergillus glaucus CBS 516.65]OJJ81778.1 hypothetical protein ASPGLDRAFT_49735 [Aspergillus glaucus CBS 516.65]
MKTLAKSTANALALQSSAHDYWDRALFALQPISVNDQKTEMKLRFYWLKPGFLLPQGSTLLLPEDITLMIMGWHEHGIGSFLVDGFFHQHWLYCIFLISSRDLYPSIYL